MIVVVRQQVTVPVARAVVSARPTSVDPGIRRPSASTRSALPETSTTSGCRSKIGICRPSLSGLQMSSASKNAMKSPVACRMPTLRACAAPALVCGITRTRARQRSTAAIVPSVDPSSTTTISTGW